ncbi:alpha/beta hydrolase [Winogradskyella maritima]|uniref:Alpha/beta fold hydrolase n=1 Tax=Winogradskyella maritima TaxID=1517766 RepID=A0ABV8AE44_9FLAO|nr:alpha/beta hydrolase [Winogradskyella maritima]
MTIDYKNASIYYEVNGTGKPVVLLHGFLENTRMWDDVIVSLPEGFQFIRIDFPGHGRSENLGYVSTMEDMAELVLFILNALNIESAQVIGHSMGGYVALAMAEKAPQLFEGLCLMNSTFEADDDERKALRARANKMVQTNFENMVRMSFANLFAPESKLKFKASYDFALSEALKTTVQGYIALQEGMRLRPDRFNVLKNLQAKKLIISGLKDWVVDLESIREKTKDADIKTVELSEGHMSHIENIEELSYILKQYIE